MQGMENSGNGKSREWKTQGEENERNGKVENRKCKEWKKQGTENVRKGKHKEWYRFCGSKVCDTDISITGGVRYRRVHYRCVHYQGCLLSNVSSMGVSVTGGVLYRGCPLPEVSITTDGVTGLVRYRGVHYGMCPLPDVSITPCVC